MRWSYKLPLRLRSLFRRSRVEQELSEELRFHLENLIDEKVANGMNPEHARCEALRELGGSEQIKEECRDMRRVNWVQDLAQDIRYGLRMLGKSPSFTAVAVLTLALGIGANTAIFSILESQLWRPLPFPDSERLVDVHLLLRQNPRRQDVLSERVFQAWREQSHSFTNLTGYLYPGNRNFTSNGMSERVMVMPMMSNLFDTLQVQPERGRAFLVEEETPGRNHVAMISHVFWRDRFNSDPSVLGKSITLDGESYTVVGIASSRLRFEYTDEPAVFVPFAAHASQEVLRSLDVLGWLAPGFTAEQAREELEAIYQRELKSEGVQAEDIAVVANLREFWTNFSARPLYFFTGAVALVLLIACVNTAGLLLARGLARQREFAVRAALGAGRGRLMRQMLVESLMLATAGGGAGALAGVWLGRWFVSVFPDLPRHAPITLDGRVLLFTLAVSVISAVLVGIAPAVFASRADLNDAMRQRAPGRSVSRGQRRARSSLVAIEVALGVVLLFGAGLFLSSFVWLQEVPRGFDAPGALTFHVSLRGDRYAKPEQIWSYFDQLGEHLGSLPGVRAVTLGSGLPLTGSESLFGMVNVAGRPPKRPLGSFVIIHAVAPNYFQVLRMHLLAGRAFNPRDTASSPRVTIINRNAARDLFGSENPIGKVLEFVADERRGVPRDAPVQIIGVAENAQEFGPDEVPFNFLFVPFAQHPVPSAFVLLASDVPRGDLARGIRATAYALDKDQPVFDMETMDDRIANSLQGARFNLFLVAALASVALILVSVGTFGTVAYFVQQRTQEFGVRLALGASPGRILCHAIAQSLAIGVTGILLGVTVSLILGRLLRHALYLAPHEHTGMLYGVNIYDPFIMSGTCTFLAAVLALASFIPARRASKVDPMVALRYE